MRQCATVSVTHRSPRALTAVTEPSAQPPPVGESQPCPRVAPSESTLAGDADRQRQRGYVANPARRLDHFRAGRCGSLLPRPDRRPPHGRHRVNRQEHRGIGVGALHADPAQAFARIDHQALVRDHDVAVDGDRVDRAATQDRCGCVCSHEVGPAGALPRPVDCCGPVSTPTRAAMLLTASTTVVPIPHMGRARGHRAGAGGDGVRGRRGQDLHRVAPIVPTPRSARVRDHGLSAAPAGGSPNRLGRAGVPPGAADVHAVESVADELMSDAARTRRSRAAETDPARCSTLVPVERSRIRGPPHPAAALTARWRASSRPRAAYPDSEHGHVWRPA